MRPKRRCVVKNQQIADNGDKNQRKIVINSLNDDALAKIIMLLSIPERIDMEKVCTKWKGACQLAWYDIKKYKCESSIGRCYDNRLLTQSYLEKIFLRCGKYLTELCLSDVCDSSIMPFVGDHCKNLTTLECKFDDDSLIDNADDFVQAFTQLDKLKCIKITVDHYYSNTTINLSAIIDSLPKEINEIHLFSKPWYNRKLDIFMSLKRFRNLKKLTSVAICLDNIIFEEISDITTLVHLNIALYNDKQDDENDMFIHRNLFLLNKLVNLEYIDFTMSIKCDADDLSTEALETIFCTCKNLKHLDIPTGRYDVAKIPLEKWVNFQNLEYLGFTCDIMPDLANTIVKYCKNLKHLRIYTYHYSIINDTALKKLTELENLECLILTKTNELHEESITAISNNCKKLKHLEIPGCTIKPAMDDDPLSSPSVLDELSKLRYLEHLNLCASKNLEDSTIIAIANNCKNMKSLNIRRCTGITETGLSALTNLENLQKLNLSSLGKVTNTFINKLKGLKKLNCSYCQRLTNSGIIKFIKNNPDLEKICVQGIKNITIDMVIGADKVTKKRTNGIILQIQTFDRLILRDSKTIITSQWLMMAKNVFSL